MSVDSKMTAIADAIRGKTGETAPLTLDEMAEAIAGLSIGAENTEIGMVTLSASTNVTISHSLGEVPTLVMIYSATPALLSKNVMKACGYNGVGVDNTFGVVQTASAARKTYEVAEMSSHTIGDSQVTLAFSPNKFDGDYHYILGKAGS